MKTALLIFTFLLSVVTSSSAQDMQRLNMARAYEQGGNLNGAARIYIELYDGGNKSDDVFAGVVRTMTGLKNYSGLLPLVTDRYESQPSSSLALVAASLEAQLGRLPEADGWWDTAVEISKDDSRVLAEVGRTQSLLMLTERAISSYQRARSATGMKHSFALQLSKLYSTSGQTKLAAEEILNHQAAANSQQETLGKLSALMTSDTATAIVGEVLVESPSDIPDRARILVWYYQQIGDWQRSFVETRAIDAQENMQGNELLRFAAIARRAGEFDVALLAYADLIDGLPQVALAAAYGYTRTLEQRLLGQDKIDDAQARDIIARYTQIIDQHSDHPLSASAMVRCAELYDYVLNDEDRARDYLTRVTNTWRGTQEASKGALHLAELYVAAGQINEAVEILDRIAQLDGKVDQEIQDLARLKLADLMLFRGDIPGAKRKYLEISSRMLSVATNDALDRLGVIMMATEDSIGVNRLIESMFLLAKRENLNAARSFVSTSEVASNVELQDRSLYFASIEYFKLGMINDSEATLNELLGRVPSSIYGDRALVLTAEILVKRGDLDGAIAALTAVLVQYPQSILVPESRERIRHLRGDA